MTNTAKVPGWLVQALLGLFLTSVIGWATWTTATSHAQETRVSIVETKVDAVTRDIDELKTGQKEMLTILREDRRADGKAGK